MTLLNDRHANELFRYVNVRSPLRNPDEEIPTYFVNNVYDRINSADLVKMNLIRRQSVNFAFSNCDAMKNCDGLLFHPLGKRAARNQVLYLSEIPAMFMLMLVSFL